MLSTHEADLDARMGDMAERIKAHLATVDGLADYEVTDWAANPSLAPSVDQRLVCICPEESYHLVELGGEHECYRDLARQLRKQADAIEALAGGTKL